MVFSLGGGEMLVAACRFVREETLLDQVMSPQLLLQNCCFISHSIFQSFDPDFHYLSGGGGIVFIVFSREGRVILTVLPLGGGRMLVAACRFLRKETILGQVMRPPILFQSFKLCSR